MAATAAALEAAEEEWGVELMALGMVGRDIPSVAEGVEEMGCARERDWAWECDIMEMGDWDFDRELELDVLWWPGDWDARRPACWEDGDIEVEGRYKEGLERRDLGDK